MEMDNAEFIKQFEERIQELLDLYDKACREKLPVLAEQIGDEIEEAMNSLNGHIYHINTTEDKEQ